MRVLIEIRAESVERFGGARRGLAGEGVAMDVDVEFEIDAGYEPVQLPAPIASEPGARRFALENPMEFSFAPTESTYVVRGTIPDADAANAALALAATHPDVVGVYSDPLIELMPTCGTSPPVGNDADVARLLSVAGLNQGGLDGSRVHVAVVDSGINVAFLQSRGGTPNLDVASSGTPSLITTAPGQHPVGHGTMCAYDVGISAPEAILLDFAILDGATSISGVLSDAVASYGRLLTLLRDESSGVDALVVTNSWGVFDPSTDFPVGSPSNYTDNPRHPFNVIVASLEAVGADILFAAGNCGVTCPDGRCRFANRPINGANSHPKVLSVGGVDVNKARVGYSSHGPGRLAPQKPDICAYTHFIGSRIHQNAPVNSFQAADTGTSAACPVAAGVVAAVRTRHPSSALPPQNLRSLIFKTAEDIGGLGYDFDNGWGVLDPKALVAVLP